MGVVHDNIDYSINMFVFVEMSVIYLNVLLQTNITTATASK